MVENNRTEWVGTDARKQLVGQNNRFVEEMKMLRHHVADMYRAWMTGKAPSPPPPSFLGSVLTQTPNTIMGDPPYSPYLPTYDSFPSHPSSSITRRPTIFPQRCFSPWDSQRHALLSKYPAPQNTYLPPRAYRKPPRSGFKPNQSFRNERFLKREKALAPIGKSYASLFERLNHTGLIESLPGYNPSPRARSFDPAKRCEYHSNARGHNVEDCRVFKREIEKMIQEGVIVIVINDSDREHGNTLGDVLTKAEGVETDSGLGNIDAELTG